MPAAGRMAEQPAPAGSPGQARPRSPSKVRRLAENWHSAPIIEDNERPHPLLNEDHLAAVAKRPEPPKPVTDDDDSTHPLLDASRDTLVTEVSNETDQPEIARRPEIVVVSAQGLAAYANIHDVRRRADHDDLGPARGLLLLRLIRHLRHQRIARRVQQRVRRVVIISNGLRRLRLLRHRRQVVFV